MPPSRPRASCLASCSPSAPAGRALGPGAPSASASAAPLHSRPHPLRPPPAASPALAAPRGVWPHSLGTPNLGNFPRFCKNGRFCTLSDGFFEGRPGRWPRFSCKKPWLTMFACRVALRRSAKPFESAFRSKKLLLAPKCAILHAYMRRRRQWRAMPRLQRRAPWLKGPGSGGTPIPFRAASLRADVPRPAGRRGETAGRGRRPAPVTGPKSGRRPRQRRRPWPAACPPAAVTHRPPSPTRVVPREPPLVLGIGSRIRQGRGEALFR